MAYLFESETCSRCQGSGHYSFCQTYGTRCFKCAGAKIVLTKRGLAAQDYLSQLQTVAIADLKIGQLIECTSFTHGGQMYRYKAPVVSVEESSVSHVVSIVNGVKQPIVEYICIKTEHPKYGVSGLNTPKNGTMRYWPNTSENVVKALAYQATLTKSGTVRKNKAKVSAPSTDKSSEG